LRALLNRIIGPILKFLGLTALAYKKITLFKNWLNYRKLKSKLNEEIIVSSKQNSKLKQICIIDAYPTYINHFIDYYYKLGIKDFNFIITDKKYSSDLSSIKHDEISLKIYYLKDSKINDSSLYNFFIYKHEKHWLHLCTINQYLVYPQYKKRNIPELCDFVTNIENSSVFGTIIHLYKSQTNIDEPNNPFDSYKYFDKFNLIQRFHKGLDKFTIRGGPLLRLFHYDNPTESPVLNRLPIVKADKSIQFLESYTYTNSNQYNSPIQKDTRVLSVAVMELVTDPALYEKAVKDGKAFLNPFWSLSFKSDSQLENLKFIQRGEWF